LINPQLPYFLPDKANRAILTILPAKFYATPNSQASLDSLKNSVVVIGGSHYEGHDIHQTPLGEMPGALVLINAMHSLLQYGDIKALPNWSKQLIIAILILVMVIIFLGVDSFWKGQVLNLLLVFLLLPISIALFRYGYWLNFATPLIFVQLYQIAVFVVIITLCLLLSAWRWFEDLYSIVKFKITVFQNKED
jgi:CHASE2 domain-containing sensor protein